MRKKTGISNFNNQPKSNMSNSKLEAFLRDEAGKLLETDYLPPIVAYQEDVNPDAINGEAWLKNETSYIWKVGVLSIADGNKRDWAYLLIGHQRDEKYGCELIGKLYYSDGENDDPGRCLKRALKCAQDADIVFDDN